MTISAADFVALDQMAARYWALADLSEDFALDTLFEAGAVFQLGSLVLEGLPAIEEFFANRAVAMRESNRTTRHLASNLLAVPQSADQVRVRSTVVVHAGHGEHPLLAALPSGIADFEDICRRQADGSWLYRSRSARTVFIGPEAAFFAR